MRPPLHFWRCSPAGVAVFPAGVEPLQPPPPANRALRETSVNTVNLAKKLLHFQRYRFFPRELLFGAPCSAAKNFSLKSRLSKKTRRHVILDNRRYLICYVSLDINKDLLTALFVMLV